VPRFAVGDIVSHHGDLELTGSDYDYVIGLQNNILYVFQYLPTAWTEIKLLTASGATGLTGTFGAAWNFQNALFFAGNTGSNGVMEPEMTTADMSGLTVKIRNVGSSMRSMSNDGANCMNVHVPFATCGDKNGVPKPDPYPVTNAECSQGGGTWYYRDSNAGETCQSVPCDVSVVGSTDHTLCCVVENIKPVLALTSFNPAQGATGVNPATNIVLTFTENMMAGVGNVVLTPATGSPVSINSKNLQVSASGASITIDPANDLIEGMLYTVTMQRGVLKDVEGNDFLGLFGTTYQFTVSDSSPPIIVAYNPLQGATDLNINIDIVLTFDEPIQAGTGSLQITGGGGSLSIPATDAQVSYSGHDMTINPTGDLSWATTYTVMVPSGGVEDGGNNDFAGISGSTYRFTTASSAPNVAPTASPTAYPTASPTATPTATPTYNQYPTTAPSASPTASPTTSPTAAPTTAPSASPTASPTTSPTASPTVKSVRRVLWS